MRGGHRTDRGNVQQLKEPINFQPLWAVNTSVPVEDVGAALVSGREGPADCAVLTLVSVTSVTIPRVRRSLKMEVELDNL